jgi:flagellar biosynthesis chaperone FliJ
MAGARSLHRLLRVRQLEEEQLKAALESAQVELRRLLDAQKAADERERRGRMLVLASIRTDELHDRLAGLEEVRSAGMLRAALSIKIEMAEQKAGELRTHYTSKRMERRQVEVLIEAAEAEWELLASRRTQQALDDGHRSSRQRSAGALRTAAETHRLALCETQSFEPEET